MTYYPRLIEGNLLKYIKIFPVVAITGPRQSGKSTLLKQQLPSYKYVTFDNQVLKNAFYDDPVGFMAQYQNKVIFDEVQKVPEIFHYIKIAVDNDRENYGKFILTGSSQFSLIQKITESLAGRIGLLTLLPFQYLEIPDHLKDIAIYSGSYPELIDRDYQYKNEWYANYLTTYLEKDVRDLSQVGDLRDFSRFITLLAANTSQLLNLTYYARDLGVAVPTIKRWISVLEASYIIFLLTPYYKNYGKRIVKSPKIYFYDTGLAAYLTQIHSKELFENGPMTGSLFENYIVIEILKRELLESSHKQLCYFRSSHGEEIDLIIDRMQSKELIEIKNNSTYKPAMTKQIKTLIEKNDMGYLLYNGETLQFDSNILIMNYKEYLSRATIE